MSHRWTSDDEARWRQLAHLAARVLTERREGAAFRKASLGDLKQACRRTAKAQFPTTSKADWQILWRFCQRCEEFADGADGFQQAMAEAFAVQVANAYSILGLTGFPPGFDGPPAAPRKPYYADD